MLQAGEYGYLSGDFLPNSGYLWVKVSLEKVTVDYVRSAVSAEGRNSIVSGTVGATYTLRHSP